MGKFIRKVGNMNVGASVSMEPQAIMGWREMRIVNRDTEMEVRTVTTSQEGSILQEAQGRQQEQEEQSR